MIIPIFPELKDPKDREEVRKALLNLTAQFNAEIVKLQAQITALTP